MFRKIASLALFAIILVFSSCRKDPEPTIATITVVNIQGDIQPNANVRLFGKASGPIPIEGERIDFTKATNSSGQARFDLSEFYQPGQTGFAVLDIRAQRGVLEGTNIIRIVEEQNNEATVVIQ
jgi:hypothetical protein